MKINENGNVEMSLEEFQELVKLYKKDSNPEYPPDKWRYNEEKCLVCNNYHGKNMPCPHMLSWS